jgi:hypothetical protein
VKEHFQVEELSSKSQPQAPQIGRTGNSGALQGLRAGIGGRFYHESARSKSRNGNSIALGRSFPCVAPYIGRNRRSSPDRNGRVLPPAPERTTILRASFPSRLFAMSSGVAFTSGRAIAANFQGSCSPFRMVPMKSCRASRRTSDRGPNSRGSLRRRAR